MDTSAEYEAETNRTIEVIELAPDGLGFGIGKISTAEQLKNPEHSQLTPEVMRIGAEVIKRGVAFVKVDHDAKDDGCGDGRPTAIVYAVGEDHRKHQFNKSRRRAKIFGGGLPVASSMYRVVIGKAITEDDSVLGDRKVVANLLDENRVEYGGHTDNHAHGDKCGCGAIDLYPEITANAVGVLRDDIVKSLKAIYGDEKYAEKQSAIMAVFASYEDQVSKSGTYFKDAQGSKTRDLMEERGSVMKQLADDHLEDFIVINDIEGTTFDQRLFDEEMHRKGVEGTAQAFVVDAWRGRMYASLIAKIAEEQYDMSYDQAYDKAEADFWIRTLAVAGTLTAGDLPVYLRRQKQDFELAA